MLYTKGISKHNITKRLKTAREILKSAFDRARVAHPDWKDWNDLDIEVKFITEAMEWYAEQDKWISVNDRLPDPGDHVLIYCSSQGIHKCFLDVLGKWRSSWDISLVQLNITHWQPLPELPKL